MVERKTNIKEIAEALDYFESVRKQIPDGNQIVLGILDEVEERLNKDLKKAVLQKFKKSKKD